MHDDNNNAHKSILSTYSCARYYVMSSMMVICKYLKGHFVKEEWIYPW